MRFNCLYLTWMVLSMNQYHRFLPSSGKQSWVFFSFRTSHKVYLSVLLCSVCKVLLSFCVVFSRTRSGCAVRLWAISQQKAEVFGTDCSSRVRSSFLLSAVWCQRPTVGWKSSTVCLNYNQYYLCILTHFHHLLSAEDVWSVCTSKIWGLVCYQSPVGFWRCDGGFGDGAACSSGLCTFQRGTDTAAGGF